MKELIDMDNIIIKHFLDRYLNDIENYIPPFDEYEIIGFLEGKIDYDKRKSIIKELETNMIFYQHLIEIANFAGLDIPKKLTTRIIESIKHRLEKLKIDIDLINWSDGIVPILCDSDSYPRMLINEKIETLFKWSLRQEKDNIFCLIITATSDKNLSGKRIIVKNGDSIVKLIEIEDDDYTNQITERIEDIDLNQPVFVSSM